jgi:hypothetical protein
MLRNFPCRHRMGIIMLAQGELAGRCITGVFGTKVMAVRKKHRSMAPEPGVKQANLDLYVDRFPYSDLLDQEGIRNDPEWQKTINKMLRHDLLNKLMVAKGGLELFDRSGEAKYLDMVRRNLDTCGEIVGRISLLDNAPGSSDLTPTDVAGVAQRVMSGQQEHGIDMEVSGKG